ncbi:MAG: hypothetical protein RR066_07090 [Mucinivorans sp.]
MTKATTKPLIINRSKVTVLDAVDISHLPNVAFRTVLRDKYSIKLTTDGTDG